MEYGPELFSALGSPARVLGRIPLIFRYLANGVALVGGTGNEYAYSRYGPGYRLRPWLLFDTAELEVIERLINDGKDEDVTGYRTMQLI